MSTTATKRKAEDTKDTDASKKPKNTSITSFFGAPKTTPGGPSTPSGKAANFDKEKWIASLTPEQKDLLKLEIDTLHESWLPHLASDLTDPSFLELKRFLKAEAAAGTFTLPPPPKDSPS